MFPDEITNLLLKYQEINKEQLITINSNIENIVNSLVLIKNNMAKQFPVLVEQNLNTDELVSDIATLGNHIKKIKPIQITEIEIKTDDNPTINTPIFEKKVYPYLVSDDICPFCNVKLLPHNIYYQRIIDDKIVSDNIEWYRCPNCKKMFAIDYDIECFDFDDTNIFLNKNQYDNIPVIDIYTVIVLSNTLNCSVNHRTKDLVAKIPVLNEEGQISYLKINASYCFECQQFTILKDDFIAIKDIVMCKIIDETGEAEKSNKNSLNDEQDCSPLSQYGYNVQTKKNISEKQRHIILASVIEANIMTRRDVTNHITSLINRGSKIPAWKTATQKWKDDKQYVSDYKKDGLPEVIFNNIILKYKTATK